ncbi:MAG: ankyrin repeat domain-containing protein [Vicinamibacterales bacterium]
MNRRAYRWWFALACCVYLSTIAGVAQDAPSRPALTELPSTAVDAAVNRSLPLLQASARTWSERRECASCHHQSLGTLAVEVARERGFPVDALAAHQQAAFTLRSRDEAASVDTYLRGQGTTGGGTLGVSYALTGLTALRWPADRVTDVLAHFIAGRQLPDGRFPSPDRRPQHEDSHVAATAFAIRALLAYGQDRPEVAARVRRGSAWLAGVDAATTEDRTMQLLGLQWAGDRGALVTRLQHALLQTQRQDGGWSQIPTRSSDAYATGQVLVALNQTGQPMSSRPYQRGVAFLTANQKGDGSWHVISRRKDEVSRGQAYFETGFPHGRDQFISYAGSAWATMALILTRPPGPSPALTDTDPRPRSAPATDQGWTDGTTPLMTATLFGTPAAIKALLDAGADPNARNTEGTTALMWAATRGVERVQLLLSRGAQPNVEDARGFTPLMFAAGYSGHGDVVRSLLRAGANVNALSANSWSALRDAVKGGDTMKLRLLLDSGGRLLVSQRNTNRMVFLAVTQEDTDVLDLLLDRGLSPDHAAQDGFTGLMSAASHGLEAPLRLLLRRGADPNLVEGPTAMTALMYASVQDPGHDRLVRALVSAGARLDLKSSTGLTAAGYAAKYGHAHLLEALRAAPR